MDSLTLFGLFAVTAMLVFTQSKNAATGSSLRSRVPAFWTGANGIDANAAHCGLTHRLFSQNPRLFMISL